MTIKVYGIPNCDTVKRARLWLDAHGVAYAFHDYKKQAVDIEMLGRWADAVGWERLLNRAGTTFRKLPEAEKAALAGPDARAAALALMLANPSAIKRPVVEEGALLLVGFAADDWASRLQA